MKPIKPLYLLILAPLICVADIYIFNWVAYLLSSASDFGVAAGVLLGTSLFGANVLLIMHIIEIISNQFKNKKQ